MTVKVISSLMFVLVILYCNAFSKTPNLTSGYWKSGRKEIAPTQLETETERAKIVDTYSEILANQEHPSFPVASFPLIDYMDKVNMNTHTCFIPESKQFPADSCNACNVLRFEAGGEFSGSVGCDISLRGRWWVEGARIKTKYKQVIYCSHYISGDKIDDRNAVTEFCNAFTKANTTTGSLTLVPQRKNEYVLIFDNQKMPKQNGRLYSFNAP